ncbi:hypothetical protein [Niveibacterium umoris]|uniref:Uncharacterized protein n=1 Tax=Niveibacterium umoris TaxID=1193620 RepID=A0A840BLM2_9RHOO|nr:hypothetical protein [Niveibacterium umoris]MBB4014135.1 hypothetical protein [Niveibacterium umoris]
MNSHLFDRVIRLGAVGALLLGFWQASDASAAPLGGHASESACRLAGAGRDVSPPDHRQGVIAGSDLVGRVAGVPSGGT